ncbi:PAS domain S-box protein [Halobacterium yunchengense]|uniref:PAS domain S-box protein n=1 Tax=Halobacterium yunchengense TaxID=3108497 RepID=UPI0030094749
MTSTALDSIRVLYVDDDEAFAAALEREDDRFTVDVAATAAAALDAIAASRVDCVVSAADLPDRNGVAFHDAVRETDPDLPFVLFTDDGPEAASEALSAAATDYLRREPVRDQAAALADRVRVAVARERERDDRRLLDALEAAREGVAVLDDDFRFVAVNRAYADRFGYEPDDLVGETWAHLYRDADLAELRSAVLPVVESEGCWRGEVVGVRADGGTFTADHVLALTGEGELVCAVRDGATDPEQARELDRAQARLEALFDNSPDMINTHDADGVIRDVNRRFCAELGYETDEIVGRGVWTVDDSVDPDDLRAALAETETGDRFRVETSYRRRDGSTIPVEVHVVRLDVAADDRFVAISRDISDRKAREDELARLKERYQAFVEHSSDLISVLDADGAFRYVSPAVERLFGHRPADLDGEPAVEYVHPDDRERVADALTELVEQSGTVTERVEYRFLDADGSWVWVESVGSSEAERTTDGYVVTTRDISRQKEHERRLEALHETTHDLLAAESREAIASIGVEAARDVIGLDANVCNLYDADRDALVPASSTAAVHDLVGDPPAFSGEESIAWRVYEEGEARAIDDVHADADVYNPGTPIRSELYLPIDDHGILIAGSPDVGAFDHEDLVLGKLLAKSLAVALDQLEQTERLRAREAELSRQNDRLEQFASFVSHDLRNPLNVAEGHLDLAGEDCDSDHLDTVADAHDRMRTLIDDLLALARGTDAVADPEPVAVDALSRESWGAVETKRATLDVEATRTVRADRSRFRQLLVNLFRNAVEHGGPDVTVTVGDLPDGVFVQDDGDGVPPEDRDDVFETGYSAASGGTGLGLAIVRQVADAHGWDVRVADGERGGARFELTGVEFVD